jgi:hypothetical protein
LREFKLPQALKLAGYLLLGLQRTLAPGRHNLHADKGHALL